MTARDRRTQATYAQIAAAYAERWRGRTAVLQQLEQFASLVPSGGWVADVGGGPGFDSQLLAAAGLRVCSLDFSLTMMKTGRDRHDVVTNFVQADMRALPLAAKLHGIWACASLLHLPADEARQALASWRRLMCPGGILYLSLKAGEGEQWSIDQYGAEMARYYCYWQPEMLDTALAEAGWERVAGWQEQSHADWLVRLARTG